MAVDEWRQVLLSEVLEVQHGFAFKGEFFNVSGTDVLLTPKNFEPSGGLNVSDERCKRYSGPTEERYVLVEGDIVVAMTDLKHDAPILGSTGVVPNGGRYLHNQRIGRILVRDPDRLHRGFVPWLLNSPSVRAGVRATATGATVRHTAPSRIRAITALLPTIDSQRRIAAVLSAFDELIEINERRIKLLEGLARSLYREWFLRFRFPGHEEVELVDSELGPIPDGWEVRDFASTGDYLNGFAFKPSHHERDGMPIVKIKELKQGITSATPRYGGAELPTRYLIEPGDLLFSWSADLGVYIWAEERGALNQHLFKVTPAADLTGEFLFHALDQALPQFRARAQGTTMKHIKRSALTEVSVAVPGPRLLLKFSDAVEPIHAEVVALKGAVASLAATRDLLLPRLVTGRLDISDVDLGVLTPTETE
jgi:type I restriction enzyme S subunit